MVSYIEPPDHEGKTEDAEQTRRRSATDEAGIAAVVDYEYHNGRTPTVLPPGHPGFDIRSRTTNDVADRLIEVKSIDGAWDAFGVGLTATQFQTAQLEREAYWLYVVEHARTASPFVHAIQDPASQISTFRLDHNWSALSVAPTAVHRAPPDVLDESAAAQLDDALPLFDVNALADATPRPVGWVRCPGASRSTHLAVMAPDRSLEPLAVIGDTVCVKTSVVQHAEGALSLISIVEQGADGTTLVFSVRSCWPEVDDDGSVCAVVLKAHEGSGVPPIVVDDPSRLHIYGSFVGVIAGEALGGGDRPEVHNRSSP